MVYVDEVTGFVSLEAYSGIGFVTAVRKVFSVMAVCIGE
jgi:hypothetical protein